MYFSTVATIRGGSLSAAKEVIPLPIMAGESWTPKIWSNQCREVGKPTTEMIPRQCQGLHPGKIPAELPRKKIFVGKDGGISFVVVRLQLLGKDSSCLVHSCLRWFTHPKISEINSQHPKRMASFPGLCLFDFECNMWLKEGEAALWRNTAFLKKRYQVQSRFWWNFR